MRLLHRLSLFLPCVLVACGSTAHPVASAPSPEPTPAVIAPGCELYAGAPAPEPEVEIDVVVEFSKNVAGCEGTTSEVGSVRDLSPSCQATLLRVVAACRETDLGALSHANSFSDECKSVLREVLQPVVGPRWILLSAIASEGNIALSFADLRPEEGMSMQVELKLHSGASVAAEYAVGESAIAGPFSAASVLDYSASMDDNEVDESVALFDSFWAHPLTEGAEGEVVLFSTEVLPKLEWTSDRAAIRASLVRDNSVMRLSTSLYDAIGHAILDVAERSSPHKLVIVATDGAENSSRCLRSSSQVVALARQHGVRIVMWGSLVANVTQMRMLTEATGGTFLYASSFARLEPTIDPLARALSNPTVLHVPDPSGLDARSICLTATGVTTCLPIVR